MTDFEDTEWMGKAACQHGSTAHIDDDYVVVDADWWHSEGEECRARDAQRARRICLSACPVRAECLAYINRHRALGGMWAGLTEIERYGKRVNHKPKMEL